MSVCLGKLPEIILGHIVCDTVATVKTATLYAIIHSNLQGCSIIIPVTAAVNYMCYR